jgi:hypothetical protein
MFPGPGLPVVTDSRSFKFGPLKSNWTDKSDVTFFSHILSYIVWFIKTSNQ